MSKFDPNRQHRRSIRLQHHDYAAASCYFITICTYQRLQIFGEIRGDRMQLNEYGQVAHSYWQAIPEHFPNAQVFDFVVMPNHLHGILMMGSMKQTLQDENAISPLLAISGSRPNQTKRTLGKPIAGSLGTIIGSFKSAVTKRINCLRNAPGTPLWQRNYYEHVIRDQAALRTIQNYITNNPRTWKTDQLHPENPTKW